MFRPIVGLERQPAVKLLTTRSTRERRLPARIAVARPDVVRQVVDMSKHQRTDGAHGLAQGYARRVVRRGVALECRAAPEVACTQRAGVRGLEPGRRVVRASVCRQRGPAVRLVATLVADDAIAVVYRRHVAFQLVSEVERLGTQPGHNAQELTEDVVTNTT